MSFGAPTNPAGVTEVVRYQNRKGKKALALVRLRSLLMQGGRAYSYSISTQRLPTPGFLEDEKEAPTTTSLPAFDGPDDRARDREPVVITDTLPSRELLTLHFSSLSLQDNTPCKSAQPGNGHGKKDDGLFAPVHYMEGDRDDGKAKAPRTVSDEQLHLSSLEEVELPAGDVALLYDLFGDGGEDDFDLLEPAALPDMDMFHHG